METDVRGARNGKESDNDAEKAGGIYEYAVEFVVGDVSGIEFVGVIIGVT